VAPQRNHLNWGHRIAVIPVRLKGRTLQPHKAVVAPLLGTRTVLTNSPWAFVSLWLKRHDRDDALFYWEQARQFFDAADGMSPQSSPLLLYYSFMNATKALLTAKGVAFNPYHGVAGVALTSPRGRIALSNEYVQIKQQGVLPSLSAYLGETETQKRHSLQELFFNLVYIHRTYCLTYVSQTDMFIPLVDTQYVIDTKSKEAYFRAKLSKDFAHARYHGVLPPSLAPEPSLNDVRAIRSTQSVTLTGRSLGSQSNRDKLASLNTSLRCDIQYINGAQTLWYVKACVAGPRRLSRFPLTLTLAAMHRLSELCRYKPMELQSFLAGQKNWLVSEFLQLAPGQFIDELVAEITGYQFLAPNVRPAS